MSHLVARVREPLRLSAPRGDDAQARELIPDADEIEAPIQIADVPRCRAFAVTDDEAVLAARGECEHAGTVGCPLRGADAASEFGQLGRSPPDSGSSQG